MDENASRNGNNPVRKRRNPTWTVMVYLAGDNNLTSNCITVLQQLEAVKYKRNVRVLACFDSNTPWPKGSRYLAINGKRRKNNTKLDWEIYNDLIISEDRDHEMTAPDFCRDKKAKGTQMKRTEVAEGLKRFMRWAMKHHPRTNPCMLVLYGHGPVVAGKTFLARENPLSSLSMTDIPKILKPHFGRGRRKLDILAFQNCAMNGIETAYELKDHVKYMIGSQGLVLAYGWPYERIISSLVENTNRPALQISEKIMKACARHLIDFSLMDRSSEQSVCDLSKLTNGTSVTHAIRELSKELQECLAFVPASEKRALDDPHQKVVRYPVICDAVRLARLEAQSYWNETFVDLYDFCERLLKKCNEAILVHNELIGALGVDGTLERRLRKTDLVQRLSNIIERCRNVIKRVEQMVPHSYYIGADLQYSHGLSIYFPWTMQGEPYSFYFSRKEKEHVLVTAFETYSRYDFAKARTSGWADFLKVYYRATLRKVRRADRKFEKHNANETLARGIIREKYDAPDEVLTTEAMQKTDSNTGPVDYEVWSNVKNYPRRNYLSPSDCPRKVETTGRHRARRSPDYQNPLSPPVSYLGWNICDFVADVIRKKPHSQIGVINNIKKQVRPREKPVSSLLGMKPARVPVDSRQQ